MCVTIMGSRSSSSVLAAEQSKLIGRQFVPMLLSLPGFRIGMTIDMCNNSGICSVDIDDVSEIVDVTLSEFLEVEVLIPSFPMAVDYLANRFASLVSAGAPDNGS